MNYSFRLKYPNRDKETLIYFTSSFKNEGKTFVYSTGEKIHPKEWDFKNKRPINLGGRKSNANYRRSIDTQLTRYSVFFKEVTARYKTINRRLTIKDLKEEFNFHFKKVNRTTNDFFLVYDIFLDEKINDPTDQAIGKATIKRYKTNKNLLIEFESSISYNLIFDNINQDFFTSFVKFCIDVKKHSANTLSRNVGLFKTFMFWALNNKYTYNDSFKNFKSIKRFQTDEVALTLKQMEDIYFFDLSENPRLSRVRDLFIFGCATGMRYSNYSKVRKKDIYNRHINVIDIKDKTKSLSVPLNKYSEEILEKYDYKLPDISNQKLNKYLKELFKFLGYDEPIKKTMRYGNDIVETISPLFQRISSHTARRSFITILKNRGVPDKIIMSYTGHRSIRSLNDYYRPNEEQKVDFMNKIFN